MLPVEPTIVHGIPFNAVVLGHAGVTSYSSARDGIDHCIPRILEKMASKYLHISPSSILPQRFCIHDAEPYMPRPVGAVSTPPGMITWSPDSSRLKAKGETSPEIPLRG